MEKSVGEVVQAIVERNTRVETDKAWERSYVRIGTIALITYVCAAALMLIIGVANPFASALIPVLGYILSTQSLPYLKRLWLAHRDRTLSD